MSRFYKQDLQTGELIPFKLVDNGDGTFSEFVSISGAVSGSGGSTDTSLLSTEATLSALSAKIPASLGQKAPAQSLSVVLASGANNNIILVSLEFTRPGDTTAYTANDAVSDSTSASTVQQMSNFARYNGGTGYIVGARLSTDKKSITPRIRIHMFNASNPTVAADNAQWKDSYADLSKRLGFFDLPAMTTGADAANSDMSRALDMGLRIPFVTAAGTRSIYFLLETLDAFTPASGERFTLTLYGDID